MGLPGRRAAHRDGVVLEEARRTKERKYPELAGNGGTCTLRGGRSRSGERFSAEANQFLRGLVSAKVRDVLDILKGKAAAAWSRRWRSMLGCVVANFSLSDMTESNNNSRKLASTPMLPAELEHPGSLSSGRKRTKKTSSRRTRSSTAILGSRRLRSESRPRCGKTLNNVVPAERSKTVPRVSKLFVRDLDLAAFNALDGRRLEVVADRVDLVPVPNLPQTPPRFLHCTATVPRGGGCRCRWSGAGSGKTAARRGPTLSWLGWRWWKGPTGGVGRRSGLGVRWSPWIRRWSAILACSADRTSVSTSV